MHKNFLGWSLESVGKGTVETKYTVEYIDDSKIADELDRTGDPALFTIRAFDNVAEALTYYLRWFVDDSCIIVPGTQKMLCVMRLIRKWKTA